MRDKHGIGGVVRISSTVSQHKIGGQYYFRDRTGTYLCYPWEVATISIQIGANDEKVHLQLGRILATT
jgi:hypothetical protein